MEISWGLCSFAFPVKAQSYEENHCRQFVHSSLSGSPQLLVVPQFPTVSWIPGAYHCIPLPSGRCLEALIAIQLPSCPTCRRAQAQIISQCIWEKLWVLGAVQKHGFSLGGGGCGFHQICYCRCGDALSFIHQLHKSEGGKSWSGREGRPELCERWEHRSCKQSTERRGSELTLMSFLFHLGRAGPSWFARPTGKYFLVDVDVLILLRGTQCRS